MALIKLQASEETSFRDACLLASRLLGPNSEAYHQQIERELVKHDRSRVMSSVNKSKKTWMEKGRKKGYNEGYKSGYQKGSTDYKIVYPCSVCGGELLMKPGSNDHVAMKKLMVQAGWAHGECLRK